MEAILTQGPKESTPIYLYIDMKEIFTDKLISYLLPLIHEGFYSIYEDSFKRDSNKALIIFQGCLEAVHKLNGDSLDKEVQRILNYYKEFKLDELYDVIMKIYQKIYNIQSEEDKISFRDFIKECYSVISREFYTSAYLFDHERDNYERQKNFREIKLIIKEQLKVALLNCLPNRHLLNKFIEMDKKDDGLRSQIASEVEQNNISRIINSILPQSNSIPQTKQENNKDVQDVLKAIIPQLDEVPNKVSDKVPDKVVKQEVVDKEDDKVVKEEVVDQEKEQLPEDLKSENNVKGATPLLNVEQDPVKSKSKYYSSFTPKKKERKSLHGGRGNITDNINIEDKIKDLIAKQTVSGMDNTRSHYPKYLSNKKEITDSSSSVHKGHKKHESSNDSDERNERHDRHDRHERHERHDRKHSKSSSDIKNMEVEQVKHTGRHSGGEKKDLSKFLSNSKKNNNEISVVSVNEFDSKNNLNKFNIAEVFSNKRLLRSSKR